MVTMIADPHPVKDITKIAEGSNKPIWNPHIKKGSNLDVQGIHREIPKAHIPGAGIRLSGTKSIFKLKSVINAQI